MICARVARYDENVASTSKDALLIKAQKMQHISELRSMQVNVDSLKVECDELRRSRSRDLEAHTAREAHLEAQRSFLVGREKQLCEQVAQTIEAQAAMEADLGQQLRAAAQEKRELEDEVVACAGVATQIAAERRRREFAEESQQVNEQHLDAEVKRLNGRIQELDGKLRAQTMKGEELESQKTKFEHEHRAAAAAAAAAAPSAGSEHSASTERRFRAYERQIEHLNATAENNLVLKGEVGRCKEQLEDAGKRLNAEVAASSSLRVELGQLTMMRTQWEVIKAQSLEWCGKPLESIAQLGDFIGEMQQKVVAATTIKARAEWDTKLLQQSSELAKAKLAEQEQKCAALEQQLTASTMALHSEKGKTSISAIELEGFKERYASIHEEVKGCTDERNAAQRESRAAHDRIKELESALAAAEATAAAAAAAAQTAAVAVVAEAEVDGVTVDAAANVADADRDGMSAAADEVFDPFKVN